MTTATAPAEAGAVAFPGPPAVLITTATRASRERPGAMPRSRTTLRVGAVNYLNSKPLIERLTDFAPSVELSLDLPGFRHAYDLGAEWTEWTDLPMVYAVWAVRGGVELGAAEQAFLRAKEYGLAHAGRIAQREA